MSKLTKLGARRLLRLATILENLDSESEGYIQTDIGFCGSTHCAWGWYMFSLSKKRRDSLLRASKDRGIDPSRDEFGISYAESSSLFGAISGLKGPTTTAPQAADGIREFVKRKGVES